MISSATRAAAVVAALLLSTGLAAASDKPNAIGDGAEGAGGLRRTRATKKAPRGRTLAANKHKALDDEDVQFWTRLLQEGRGKETGIMSMPTVPRPPSGGSTPRPTPRPTIRELPTTPEPTTEAPTTYPPTVQETPSPTDGDGLTEDERRSQIVDVLSVVSFPDLFEDPSTPQAKALDWIVDDDAARLSPDDDKLVQRYTLAVFYYSTSGDGWKKCSAPSDFTPAAIQAANQACTLTTVNATTIFPNDIRGTNAWLTPGSECRWGGISCYAANTANAMEVNVVEFENNGLKGSLPGEMEQLDKMRFFALERGELGGPIPASYGNLKSLLLLDFDFNQLTGPLPSALWELTSLRQLDLNDNNFVGELSGDIGKLRQLRFFQIDNNGMTGAIPAALGDIPSFSLIGLSGNDFVGAMPSKVCDLRPSPLQTLVADCSIECEIPACCTSCVPDRR